MKESQFAQVLSIALDDPSKTDMHRGEKGPCKTKFAIIIWLHMTAF